MSGEANRRINHVRRCIRVPELTANQTCGSSVAPLIRDSRSHRYRVVRKNGRTKVRELAGSRGPVRRGP